MRSCVDDLGIYLRDRLGAHCSALGSKESGITSNAHV